MFANFRGAQYIVNILLSVNEPVKHFSTINLRKETSMYFVLFPECDTNAGRKERPRCHDTKTCKPTKVVVLR